MFPALLGVMELEKRSESWADLGQLAITWLQDVGGFAAVGLLFWVLYVVATPAPAIASSRRTLISHFMAYAGITALIVYLVAFGLTVAIHLDAPPVDPQAAAKQQQNPDQPPPPREGTLLEKSADSVLAIGGLFAIIALGEPFVLDLFRLRGRRIYALAKLSFKEAVRRRVIWVFFIFLLIFLFPATWFGFKQVKPEDMLKTTIGVVALAMTVLLTATALLLSGFSIPNDIKNQTIHTIVTKPVERFEIVLGRFLGYAALETIALFFLTAASLLFILTSNVDEAAKKESMKARLPIYGQPRLRTGTARRATLANADVHRCRCGPRVRLPQIHRGR